MAIFAATELSEDDLDFLVRECGGVIEAVRYCERIADVAGPLSNVYQMAAERLMDRRLALHE